MIGLRFFPLVWKQIVRHKTRSMLTVAGVAIGMFLFVAVQTLQSGVSRATEVTAADQTLVVYRANRYCPATSRLPEYYESRIAKIDGVLSIVPMKIVVNNCAASLDVVTFRGVSPERISSLADQWGIISGSVEEWHRRSDAALVGERLAERRGLQVGEAFSAAGVTVTVAGIVRSQQPQDQDVAYVSLSFLQQSLGRAGPGSVTQFNVTVTHPSKMEAVALAIDDEFRADAEPTQTNPERAFVAQAASDMVEIVKFTQFVGWGCLGAVMALVSNAIVLSVQDRIREHAVLQSLGFQGSLVSRLVVFESALIGLIGGVMGSFGAMAVLYFGNFTLYNEGMSISIQVETQMILQGLGLAAGVGVLAGLVPAIRAGRREITECFRAI